MDISRFRGLLATSNYKGITSRVCSDLTVVAFSEVVGAGGSDPSQVAMVG
jgi:hypothetical protein